MVVIAATTATVKIVERFVNILRNKPIVKIVERFVNIFRNQIM